MLPDPVMDQALADAERGARLVDAALPTSIPALGGNDSRELTKAELDARLAERIARAKDYAIWRVNAHRDGTCANPY